MEQIKFMMVCAWGTPHDDKVSREQELTDMFREPASGLTLLGEPRSTFGFWVNAEGQTVVEPSVAATFTGSYDSAQKFANIVGYRFQQECVQLTIRDGMKLVDRQIIFTINPEESRVVLGKLITAGVRGAIIVGDTLRVNVDFKQSSDVYDVMKTILKRDGETRKVSIVNHLPVSV